VSLPWKLAAGTLVCLGSVAAAAQQSDQVLAERLLGPEWKKMARTAGMVFSGTVLGVEASPTKYQDVPTIELQLRVDGVIAGVTAGQVLTIREWAGAWSMHRPMRPGDHVLLLLYPRSRLGFTSPVGGALGQIALEGSGTNVAERPEKISVRQLERAIRSARKE